MVETADEGVGPALLDETASGAGSDGPAAGGGRGPELDPVIPTLFPKDGPVAGVAVQQRERRRDAAGKRSTTVTTKRNRDQDSKTNTSQPLTSTHAEQSLRASDSPLESRNGIVIALQKKNSLSYKLRRVFYASATLKEQYSRYICMTPRRMTRTFTSIR